MSTGLYFSEVFSKILKEADITCYQLNQYINIDQAYLYHHKNGEKSNPSPETLMKISLGLVHCSNKVKLSDIENLFKSVGRSLRI